MTSLNAGNGNNVIYRQTKLLDFETFSCKLSLAVVCNKLFFVQFRNNEQLELRYNFEGHQLGIVSVDINASGTGRILQSDLYIWTLL